MVSINDFKKLDVRVAKVDGVREHPNADKLLILDIDIGNEKRQIVAGIKNFYKPEELIEKKIVVIVNLEPATIRGVESAGMLLACQDKNTLSLLVPERDLEVGSKVT